MSGKGGLKKQFSLEALARKIKAEAERHPEWAKSAFKFPPDVEVGGYYSSEDMQEKEGKRKYMVNDPHLGNA